MTSFDKIKTATDKLESRIEEEPVAALMIYAEMMDLELASLVKLVGGDASYFEDSNKSTMELSLNELNY